MAKKDFKETDLYTILFAVGMVIVVGVGLAALASATKPNIEANRKIEKQQNILESIGLSKDNMTKNAEGIQEYSEYIKEEVIVDANGNAVESDLKAFDINVRNDKENFPIYIAEKDGKKFYIAPLYGKGLWDDIWGYMSLTEDLTVNGVVFDHRGETPGLGAEITQDFFEKRFLGEHVLDQSGNFKGIAVSKTNNDPANSDVNDNEVDAITGATITGNGVAKMIEDKLKVYVKYIQNQK